MFFAQDPGGGGRGPFDDFWYAPVFRSVDGAPRVTATTAVAIPTLFACVQVLGQTVGVVPLHLYKRVDKGRERATGHPLYKLLHRQPNRWQTSFQFRQMLQWHLGLRGNAYARLLFGRRGEITELVPLHPDKVRIERFQGADSVVDFRYVYKRADGTEATYVRGELLHLRGLSADGIEGFSPIEAQAESFGEALTAQRFTSRTLANDARPGGVLEWQGAFKNDEERAAFRKSWQDAQGGANRGKTAVLERGMSFKEVGAKPADLQLMDLRKMKGYDVAAAYRMPPHKVGLMERATFTNIEHQGIEFVTDTMLPWYVNWEQELGVQLLLEAEQDEYYFEFNVDGLLRGDAKTRAEYYGKRFATASMSPNDIRRAENEEAIDGGDRYFVPVNVVPLDRADDVVDKGGNHAGGINGGDGKAAPGSAAAARAAALERAAAERIVRKEAAALGKIVAGEHVLERAEEFYRDHIAFVEDVFAVPAAEALEYCERRMDQLREAWAARSDRDAYLAALSADGPAELLAIVGRAAPGAAAADPVTALAGAVAELAARPQPAPQVTVGAPRVNVGTPDDETLQGLTAQTTAALAAVTDGQRAVADALAGLARGQSDLGRSLASSAAAHREGLELLAAEIAKPSAIVRDAATGKLLGVARVNDLSKGA